MVLGKYMHMEENWKLIPTSYQIKNQLHINHGLKSEIQIAKISKGN